MRLQFLFIVHLVSININNVINKVNLTNMHKILSLEMHFSKYSWNSKKVDIYNRPQRTFQ